MPSVSAAHRIEVFRGAGQAAPARSAFLAQRFQAFGDLARELLRFAKGSLGRTVEMQPRDPDSRSSPGAQAVLMMQRRTKAGGSSRSSLVVMTTSRRLIAWPAAPSAGFRAAGPASP